MKGETKIKGDISEIKVISWLIENGFSVSIPFGENQRYDLIVDSGNRLIKIQVKTGRLRNGSIRFDTCSGSTNGRFNYVGEIDYFISYCPDTDKIYILDIDNAPLSVVYLRFNKTKSNQIKGIRFAKDYEIKYADIA